MCELAISFGGTRHENPNLRNVALSLRSRYPRSPHAGDFAACCARSRGKSVPGPAVHDGFLQTVYGDSNGRVLTRFGGSLLALDPGGEGGGGGGGLAKLREENASGKFGSRELSGASDGEVIDYVVGSSAPRRRSSEPSEISFPSLVKQKTQRRRTKTPRK